MTRIRMVAAVGAVAGVLAVAGCATKQNSAIEDSLYVEGPPVVRAQPAESSYCYRTLAAVTCYETPSPHPHDTLIGIVRPGLPAQPPAR